MTELDPSASLTMATARQKRKSLGVVVALLLVVGAAVAFYFLYSAPREKKKKLQLKTQTAWSWYSQLAICLGGPGTPPGDPTAIYARTLTAFEDDPMFIKRAKECGHAGDILDGLRDVMKVGPNAATRAVIEPLIEDTRKLQLAVLEFVGMAIEGPIKGEDTGKLYGELWKVAIGFEKLHELVGLPSPLKPVASKSDAPSKPTEMPSFGGPPVAPAATALVLPTPREGMHGAGVPARDGALGVTWDGGDKSLPWVEVVLPTGGSDTLTLRDRGSLGPFRVQRPPERPPQLELTTSGPDGWFHDGSAHVLPGRPVVQDDAGGLLGLATGEALSVLSRAGVRTAVAPAGKWLALGGAGKQVMALYRAPAPAPDDKKQRIEVRVSDDGGRSFGGVLSTKMDLLPPEVLSPGCIAGQHLWFGAYEIGYHSADGGKTFRRMTVYQPQGGGFIAQILCAADGRAAFVFHPRNERKAGLWVAGCAGADCNSTTQPEPMTMRRTTGSAVALVGDAVIAVWAEERRLRIRRAPSVKNLTYWDGSQPLVAPENFPAGARLIGLSARPEGAVVAWTTDGKTLSAVATHDDGKSWGPP